MSDIFYFLLQNEFLIAVISELLLLFAAKVVIFPDILKLFGDYSRTL